MSAKFKKAEQKFDKIVDIRIKARMEKDLSTIERTEEEFKKAKDNYLKALYENNSVQTTDEEKDKVKRMF